MDSPKTQIKSHIQLPRCILKRFTDDQEYLYYFDASRVRHEGQPLTSRGHAKSFNTESGYYSLDIENYLDRDIENPLSALLEWIEKLDFGADAIIPPDDFRPTVFNYVYSLLSRSPGMLQAIGRSSIAFRFAEDQSRHDMAAKQGILYAKEQEFWKNYAITFLINNSKTPFFLPNGGLYGYTQEAYHVISMPISPWRAIILIDQEWVAKNLENDKCKMMLITRDDDVQVLNNYCIQEEMHSGRGCIVSNDREALEQAVQRLVCSSLLLEK